MLIKETIPFVDNSAAQPQLVDPHLGLQGTSPSTHTPLTFDLQLRTVRVVLLHSTMFLC